MVMLLVLVLILVVGLKRWAEELAAGLVLLMLLLMMLHVVGVSMRLRVHAVLHMLHVMQVLWGAACTKDVRVGIHGGPELWFGLRGEECRRDTPMLVHRHVAPVLLLLL